MKHYINPNKILRIEAQNATNENPPRVVIDMEGESFAIVKANTYHNANNLAERLGEELKFLRIK